MNNFLSISLISATLLFTSCKSSSSNTANEQSQETKTLLSVSEFADKLKATPDATILDVRTSGEYAGGHIQNSKNVDWNGNDFDTQTASLDKAKPVFVYCLSGARSASAASHLRSQGFTAVYELEGGMMKWRAAGQAETTETTAAASESKGMTRAEFDALLSTEKTILIDIYADWCEPCKRMKPSLDEISKEMASTVEVIRINADENPSLMQELAVDALPTLIVFKNKDLKWKNVGFTEKSTMVKQLK